MIHFFSVLVIISSFQIIASFKPHILIKTKSLNVPFILQKQSNTLQAVSKFYDVIRSRLIPSSTYAFASALFATFDPSNLLFALLFQKAYTSVFDSINNILKNYQKEKSYKSIELLQSLLNFVKDRCGLLSKLFFLNYFIKIICNIFISIGFRIQSDFSSLLSRITYTFFFLYVLDLFKSQYMQIFFPSISDNRRQSYVINRSTSVMLWVFGGLMICEMVSTYLKVPLSSTLAFGGFSGLAIGLSARDIATNFIGGMILLFNEPFTPGDMVTFKAGNTEFEGRVERIGWAQTRIRGRDTRPTYIPNSHFIQIPITNMERITHRKFETTVPIRIQVLLFENITTQFTNNFYLS